MKRMLSKLFLLALAACVPLTLVNGQEKKNEQKIRIVINDGSGEKTVIDTTFTGDKMPEIITLRNGEILEPGKDIRIKKSGDGSSMIRVTASSDNKDGGNDGKKIIIASAGTNDETIGDKDADKFIVISDETQAGKENEKTFTVKISEDKDKDTSMDKTKYVIAKDGLVVTVEGNDEAKAKELIEEIEAKLGVNKDDQKGTTKVEVTKKVRK